MITAPPPVRTIATRTLGTIGLTWALAYVPIHLYWGLGGTSTPIGITGTQPGFRVANWGACVVIVGAGLTCLALTRPWGERLPGALRRGTAWVGGLFALAHWLLYTAFCALRVAGAVGYPVDADASPQQLRAFDWANLGYFELWFGVMGVLLIVLALRTRGIETGDRAPSRAGTALVLAGVGTVVWGVFTFNAWIFALCGPVLIGAGLLTLHAHRPVLEGANR